MFLTVANAPRPPTAHGRAATVCQRTKTRTDWHLILGAYARPTACVQFDFGSNCGFYSVCVCVCDSRGSRRVAIVQESA